MLPSIPTKGSHHQTVGSNTYVTKTRDRKAALKFPRKSMRRHGRPETILTDRLRSYAAALKDLGRGDDREMGRWLNNRSENSHQPFRRRERAMLRFRQMRCLQNFASVHASFHNHFNRERIAAWRADFNTARPNSSLGYITPAAYAASLKPQWPSAFRSKESSSPMAIAHPAQTRKSQPMIPVAAG